MLATSILAAADGGSTFQLLVPATYDLIWGSVAFAIVALIIYKLAWPTFVNMLDERGRKIEDGLKAAEIARAEIAAQQADLEEQIRDAQREANEIRDVANENAKSILEEARVKAKAEADQIIEAAGVRIAADADAARRTLRTDVGSLATELASRIVGESLTDSELAKRVTDRFLDELEVSLAPSHQEV
ncbi:MAG: F0F1 ATP synthase subunit B [Actinomycetaceae bacterium]|nr:F0F1 ATP synthase subunit B [Actinomycetaceae bacterium]